jgi:hypothetical protein
MIGIINNEISALSLIDKITNKFSKVDIYLYKEEVKDIEEVINLLLEKNCKIIILKEKNTDLEEKYQNINFLYLEDLNRDNGYILDNNDLVEAVEEGNEKKVKEILSTITIPTDKTIILNNPKLLFIKSIICETFNNEVIDNIDILLDKIANVLDKDISSDGNIYLIK